MKVVELASVLAGPAVGMFFAELEAEVIKIENKKTGGDVTRNWKLPSENKDSSVSSYYASVNYKKRTIFLDLNLSEDRELLFKELEDADILIANYRTSSAKKLGVDYETIKKINPKIIYANITGFGEDSERAAFDVVLQAESGFMYMNGQIDTPPTKMPVALIDILAAHQLKEGILYALWQREKEGKGAYVSVSLIESAISALANQATNWLMAGHIPQRIGSIHPNIAPYGEVFKTKDGKLLVLAIGNDKQFLNLCNLLNIPQMARDTRFEDNISRVCNRQELKSILQEAFLKIYSENFLSLAQSLSIPVGVIRNMKEVFELKEAENMILEDIIENQQCKRVKTAIFKYKQS